MLTPEQAAERAADLATRSRAAGADAADAVFSADAATGLQVRMGALEDVGRSESADMSLRVFVGTRSASVSTSDLSDDAIDALIERAVAMARLAPEDPWAGLAPAERLLKGAPPQLDLDDHGDPAPDVLKTRAIALEEAARAVPGVVMSDGASASASRVTVALATSHGFAGGYSASGYSMSTTMLSGGKNGAAMERDYDGHSARHQAMLETPEEVGRRAGERAAARANPGRIDSGTMPIVFEPRLAAGLIGHFVGAIAGPAITRRTSFLIDALGEAVFAPGVTVIDDPHRPRGLRSRPFDGEGLPVAPVELVTNGVLETWLLDAASARQLRLEPTGHGARGGGVATSNLYLAAGAQPRETLIGDIARGVYLTELIGHGVNPVTGDYSRGAAGFLIEDGEITRAVAEFTIAGNLRDMFRALTPANDLVFRYGTNAPTVRVDGMTVASG